MKQFLRSLCTLLLLMIWCSVGFAAAGDNFTLVTAESELKAGDIIIIVNQEEKKALSTNQKTNNRDATLVTISGNTVTSSDKTQEITLEGASGAWYFNVGNRYLYAASSSNNKLKTQAAKNDDSKASISIKSSGAAIKFLGQYSHNILRYNPDNNGLFNCYESAKFNPVFIYKKTATKTLTSLAISGEPTKKAYNAGEAFDPTGLIVTGTYDDASTATITDGITWTKTPATLTVGTTSCSVTATINGVTSPAYDVTGLTVTKTIKLSIDPATSTVVKAPVKVTLTADAGATIYYTTNGDDPTTTSTKYTAPFEVTKSGTTVKALAVADGAENVTAEATYTIQPDQPVFSDESKTFKDAFNVTLSLPESTDANSTIHYAIGATATAESPLYKGPINISAENDGDKVILRAVVVDPYGNVGQQKYCTYTKTTAIVFDFTANPNAWGIKPQKDNSKDGSNVVAGKELKVSGVMMTATNGSQYGTCLYGTTSVTLNVYNGGSITFTAPDGYNISEIKFDNSKANFTTKEGNYANGIWVGNAHAVKFSNNDNKIAIKTATIKLVATFQTLDESKDNTETISNNNGKAVDIKLTRTLIANKWNTFCVPFETEIAGTALEGATVKTIGTVVGNVINLEDATKIEAGVPYLVMPNTENIVNPTFKNVTISVTTPIVKGNDEYKFVGTYSPKTITVDEFGKIWGVTAEGKLAKINAKTTMKGLRAYFVFPTNAAAAKLNFDGETTGINSIETEATVNGKVYNLNGQYVGNSLNGLKKGIYVVNGKKVIK